LKLESIQIISQVLVSLYLNI